MTDGLLGEKFTPDLRTSVGDLYDLYAYIDGKFFKGDDAKISFWDHGFLYGDGVFEGIRLYDGKIFKLEDHVERLFDSAIGIRIEIPLTKEEMKRVIIETVKINNLRNAHIRPIVTRGMGKPGIDPKICVRPSVIVLAYPFPPILGKEPAKLITSSLRRKSPHSIDPRIKSLNYLDAILVKMQASNAKVDDAIVLDHSGYIAEASAENLFIVKNGKLFTPTTVAALEGITRATIMDIAGEMGIDVDEKNLVLGDLYTADEAFLTGSAAELVSIGEVDGRKIGSNTPGHITTKLADRYRKYSREEYTTNVYE